MNHSVSIKTEDGSTRIWIDEQEVKGIVSADVSFRVNKLPLVTLQLLSDKIEIKADESRISIGGKL